MFVHKAVVYLRNNLDCSWGELAYALGYSRSSKSMAKAFYAGKYTEGPNKYSSGAKAFSSIPYMRLEFIKEYLEKHGINEEDII